MIDTNTVIEITTNGVPVTLAEAKKLLTDPAQLTTLIAAWSAVLILLAGTLGRIWHAFKTGAGIGGAVAAVFKGTNRPTDSTVQPPPKP